MENRRNDKDHEERRTDARRHEKGHEREKDEKEWGKTNEEGGRQEEGACGGIWQE